MKRNDTTFKEMVSRIASGELTRKQAADVYGVKYGTLMVWLGRSGLNDETAFKGPARAGGTYGAAADWPVLTPERAAALDAAVARVVAGESTALGESKANPEIKLSTITQRVRSARGGAAPLMGRPPATPREPKVEVDATPSDYDFMLSVLASPERLARVAAVVRAAGL